MLRLFPATKIPLDLKFTLSRRIEGVSVRQFAARHERRFEIRLNFWVMLRIPSASRLSALSKPKQTVKLPSPRVIFDLQRVPVRFEQPGVPVLEIAEQFGVLLRVHLARPNH